MRGLGVRAHTGTCGNIENGWFLNSLGPRCQDTSNVIDGPIQGAHVGLQRFVLDIQPSVLGDVR